jgi:hypothetical protein
MATHLANTRDPNWGERQLVQHNGAIRHRNVGTHHDMYLAGILYNAWDVLVYIVNFPQINDARHLLADTYGFRCRPQVGTRDYR